jgi:hypothetical protein
MRFISIAPVLLLFLFSCKKGPNNQENSVPPKKNTVTYTSPFSGTTYTVNETNSKVVSNTTTYVDGKIETSAGVSSFNLDVVGSNLPFTLSIHIPHGPVGGNGPTGWYTTQTQYGGTIKIKDKFSDLYGMPITGDSIFVTNTDSSKIIGNYVIHVYNGNSDHRIIGAFTINEPVK